MFSLAEFIAEAAGAARLEANTRGCPFAVAEVGPLLGVVANRDLLLAALANLLHNAFKFTQHQTEISLTAYALGDRIIIDVADNCGGLSPGDAEKLFVPFAQRSHDKTGVGLGLSIARQSVTEQGGLLTVKDMPGVGCTFTINLPRHTVN
jgi:signal transduction histidine kinase